MSRDHGTRNLALAIVAGAIAIGVAFLALDRGGGADSTPASTAGSAIEARAVLSPRNVLFGDTVRAVVEVTLDRERVDPNSVRVQADFTPWQPVAPAERAREDGKTTTYLQVTYVLRCLVPSCLSTDVIATQDFTDARVGYTSRGTPGGGDQVVVPVAWPQLLVGSRYLEQTQGSATVQGQLRADLVSLPRVTYRLAPSLLLVLILAATCLFAIAGGALVYLELRRSASGADPAAGGPPEPVLTPLERALLLLESPTRANGGADGRRALELVAASLLERGELTLAQAARALAWSEPVPGLEETGGLAVRARSVLGEVSG